jgi:hypothetical protein
MGVFDGSIKTQRRVKDPISDKLVARLSSLTLAAINTPGALVVPGSDVSVINGDQQLQVHQNRYMKVGMNQDVKIGMNETYLVGMNQSITVMQNYTRDIFANSLIHTTGNYTKNVLSNYTKAITGFSVNTIAGFYSKSVAMDYTKTIVGTSTNVITGTYTKKVQCDYVKVITGTSSNTITGDYTKILISNYVKDVTGNSSVKVVSESKVQYVGNHNRTCSADNTVFIGGTHTHTTCGPTIKTEIDVAVTQQIDNHIEAHPTNLTQEKNSWFASAVAKGDAQVVKVDVTGFQFQAEFMKMDMAAIAIATYPLYCTAYGSTNSYFLNKFELGLVAGKALGVEAKSIGAEVKGSLFQNHAGAMMSRLGIFSTKFKGSNNVVCPLNTFAGILLGANQFM